MLAAVRSRFRSESDCSNVAINCRCSKPSNCSRRPLREACGAEPSTIKATSENRLPDARPNKAMNADRSVLALVKTAQSATIGTRKARCHQVKRALLRSTKANVDRLTRSRSLIAWERRRARRAGLFTRGVLRFMVLSCCMRVGGGRISQSKWWLVGRFFRHQ